MRVTLATPERARLTSRQKKAASKISLPLKDSVAIEPALFKKTNYGRSRSASDAANLLYINWLLFGFLSVPPFGSDGSSVTP